MPVICGGTNYYIESLLWRVLLDHDGIDGNTVESVQSKKAKFDDQDQSTADLYEQLKKVDPHRANELHPNERRKIVRSLEGTEHHSVAIFANLLMSVPISFYV
jgi:tRNA dimethylallyltransferase